MALRRAAVSVSAVAFVVGLAGCVGGKVFGIFGPDKDDDKEGKFGIGSSVSFVTTGGATCGAQPCPVDDITFIVPDEVTHEAITQRMSFNAKGGATPSGVFNFTGKTLGTNTHIHGDIVCYTISGNQARVAGHITSSDPAQPLGEDNDAVWIVEDNGEGSVLDKDRISLYASMPHLPGNTNCLTATALEGTMYSIETGNVQIHN